VYFKDQRRNAEAQDYLDDPKISKAQTKQKKQQLTPQCNCLTKMNQWSLWAE